MRKDWDRTLNRYKCLGRNAERPRPGVTVEVMALIKLALMGNPRERVGSGGFNLSGFFLNVVLAKLLSRYKLLG
jgi:hypothetical protein